MAPARPTAFETCHAAVPATLFAGVAAIGMLAVQPVLAGISLAGALAYSLVARGAAATARGLAWQLPMLALVCLANPLFSASGSTLVLKLGPRSVYAESLAFGATMGALMVATVVWLEEAAAALPQDQRADSMRARGWESGGERTAYRPERLRPRDAAWLAVLLALVAAAGASAWLACSTWRFYPRMSGGAPWWAYVAPAALALLPAALELAARARERGLS